MIIQNHPELGLQKHQIEAFSNVKNSLKNGNKSAVVLPTGCGKSFVALQLMADNKDKKMLFLTPTNAIKNQMYNYIAKYVIGEKNMHGKTTMQVAKEYFPNLKITLYPALARMKKELFNKLKPEVIVMDELHRTGADLWGRKVTELIENNPDSKILGITATPDRMDSKNVVDEMFDGNISYELKLVDAIKRGIVKPPKYVKCDYMLSTELEGMQDIISKCEDKHQKKSLEEKYERMRKIIENADGIPELFEKNMTEKNGKYIVFCKDENQMKELIENSKEWFEKIDKEPEIYTIHSNYGEKKNEDEIEKFTNSKSEHLKLLYSVNMLNEGLHLEDITGIIMTRKTDSRIIYLQQLGRVLSSAPEKESSIVFDLANNYISNNLDREINTHVNKEREITNKENMHINSDIESLKDIDIFRIQGETKEFLELLDELKSYRDRSYLINARKIKEWMEEHKTTKPPSTRSKNEEEKRLGTALGTIRQYLLKPYNILETEEEKKQYREKHPELEEVMQIVEEIDRNNISIYLENARKIKEWMEEHKTTKPPSASAKNEEEKRLGMALRTIRQKLLKPYNILETEEEKTQYKIEHPELEEVMQIIEEIDRNNISAYLENVRKIKEWMEEHKTTKPPSPTSKNEEEKRLGTALGTIRRSLLKPYNILETEEEKKQYREKHPELEEVMQIIEEIDKNNISIHLENARKIKEWMEEHKTTKPPSASAKNEEEKRLGTALGTIRKSLLKPYNILETEEEKKQYKIEHPELEEVMQIIEEIDRNNISIYLENARKIKEWMEEHKTTKPPSARSKNEEEKRLGIALITIRSTLLKPYNILETEEEKTQYKLKHPELEEVMQIVEEIDKNKSISRKELDGLIEEAKQVNEKLDSAVKLEKEYKEINHRKVEKYE